jgi:hypothetical protein
MTRRRVPDQQHTFSPVIRPSVVIPAPSAAFPAQAERDPHVRDH